MTECTLTLGSWREPSSRSQPRLLEGHRQRLVTCWSLWPLPHGQLPPGACWDRAGLTLVRWALLCEVSLFEGRLQEKADPAEQKMLEYVKESHSSGGRSEHEGPVSQHTSPVQSRVWWTECDNVP